MSDQIDAAGNHTVYGHDSRGDLTSITNPDSETTQYRYDPVGNRTESVGANGLVVYYYYDGDHELTGIYYSGGQTPDVSESYDENGNRTYLSDGSGTSTFTYDPLDRLTSATNGSGASVSYGYDLAGNLTSLTYPNGQTVSRSYDAGSNLTSVTDWLGNTTHFGYDPESNLAEERYAGEVRAQRGYDAAGRPNSTAVSHGGEALASFSYQRDELGQLSDESSNNGTVTELTMGHDSLGQLVKAGGEGYGYDAAGNPTVFGAETTQAFDPAGELTSVTGPVGLGAEGEPPAPLPAPANPPAPKRLPPPVALPSAHDAGAGSVGVAATAVAKASGIAVLRTGPLQAAGSGDLLLAFVSVSGQGEGVKAVSGGGLHWTELAHVAGASGLSEAWEAHTQGRFQGSVVIHLNHPTHLATATAAAYGDDAFVSAKVSTRGRASVPTARVVTPPGSLLWAVGHSSGQGQAPRSSHARGITSEFLNRRDRLAGWVQSGTGPTLTSSVRAAHWALLTLAVSPSAGARAESGTAAASGAHSVRPSADAGDVTALDASGTLASRQFGYDADGQRTAEGLPSGSYRALTYDEAGRLTAFGASTTYTYDGDGLRTSKTVGGTPTSFTWGRAGMLPELLEAGSTEYIYGPEGEPVEEIRPGSATFMHGDQHGSVRLLTDAAGATVGRYDYTPWGAVLRHSGAATSDLQFDGQYTDAESGFQYLRSRYYDPATGQFLTPDPAFPITRSRYGFVANDPSDGSDPTGLLCLIGRNPNGSCRGSDVVGPVTNAAAEATGLILCVAYKLTFCDVLPFQQTIPGSGSHGPLAYSPSLPSPLGPVPPLSMPQFASFAYLEPCR
jgi:RHS repeat-associated protein